MHVRTALSLLVGPVLSLGCDIGARTDDTEAPVKSDAAALRRMQSCQELTRALREDALDKMNRRIDAEIRAIEEGYPGGYAFAPGGFANAGAPTEVALPGPQVTDDSGNAPKHSETETQVYGVDEADIVKAVGTRLYVLHGKKFLIVDAWPAPALALAGGVEIEGTPGEMFVAEGRAVVFSTVDAAPILAAAGVPLRGSYADGYAPTAYPRAALVAAAPVGSVSGVGLTKVTVLALEGASASVVRESYFEGRYLSSRRVEDRVRLVLEGGGHGPAIDYNPKITYDGVNPPSTAAQTAAWEALRQKNAATIAATTHADWLPMSFVKEAAGIQASAASCGDYFVPSAGSTEYGVTQLVTFDLRELTAPPRSVAVVGAADTVYGDATSIVLAGRAYADPWAVRQAWAAYVAIDDSSSASAAAIPVQTLNYTHLHLFDISASNQPLYVASGTVDGEVKDQFGIDHAAGRVRVTTTEAFSGPQRSDGKPNLVSHVFVLANESGKLVVEGDAGAIAPGEQLYATRFVGDKAYVVTWHVVDPLFVIDLANPKQPKILGELHIPGFSEYMHPLDETHLLTIGRETDEEGHQHTDDGFWYGIAIQVFDVTDPLKPALQHKYVYGSGEYATTEATENHKAFTYFDDRKLLAFPCVRQSGWGNGPSGPSSTLEVFHVDVAGGITKLGSVDHGPLLGTTGSGNYGYCGGYFDGAVRRGVFFENFVYSISYGGVLANDVADLAKPVGSLKLENPSLDGLSCAF